jgi:predicted dehydrogenase
MNFALLGCDRTLLPLVRAIVADPRHRLHSVVSPPPSLAAELMAIAPGVRIESEAEGLPYDPGVDAVIAVVGSAAVDEAVKQTAAAGKPVLLVPNGDPASALVYELTLIRDDVRVPLVPMFPLRFCGPLRTVSEFVRNDESVEPLNLQWTRDIVPSDFSRIQLRTGASGRGLLTARDVHRALIHDADILRQLGGNYSQVTAVRSGTPETGLSMVAVTLAGAGLPTATWIARPATDGPLFELSIPTNAGVVALRGQTAAGEIRTVEGQGSRVEGQTRIPALDSRLSALDSMRDAAKSILDHFENAVVKSGKRRADEQTSDIRPPTSDLRLPPSAFLPDWTDLLRATEIVEAAERSVRRRRTIDLHFETTSERNQFKTQMTAIGCGLMSMTLIALIFLLMAGALFNMHPMVMKIARVGIFVPLVLFLLLQALLFVSRPSKDEVKDEGWRMKDKG